MTRHSSVVIGIQEEEDVTFGFTGLYNVHVPSRAWIGENTFIFQSTIKCRTVSFVLKLSIILALTLYIYVLIESRFENFRDF